MRRLRYDTRILLLAWAVGLPGSVAALISIWIADWDLGIQVVSTILLVAVWTASAVLVRGKVAHSLRTLASLLEGLHNEDYSLRAHRSHLGDSLDEVHREINQLSESLSEQRLSALEATALLRTVIGEIEHAVFAFDPEDRLRLVNRAGEKLLARPASRLLGHTARELGLDRILEEPERSQSTSTVQHSFPGAVGRWNIRRSTFRQEGLPHRLLVLTDLSRTLRQEERQAWQRLIRVLGHELNNSLAPIQSTAATLAKLLDQDARDPEWRDDMQRGLELVRNRSSSLGRFMASYSRLARLPAPELDPLEIGPLVERVAALEVRLPIQVIAGPSLTVEADSAQIEQMLINLVKNAVEACLEAGGEVQMTWSRRAGYCGIVVEDDGPGLADTMNLFVPFFTTKKSGSGIGLVLSRQIAEVHGSSLTLANRADSRGCRAEARLPLAEI